MAVDPLDHLLASRMFEIDIDIGRLAPRLETNRSNSRLLRAGSMAVMPST
jgi:hypothetical protein